MRAVAVFLRSPSNDLRGAAKQMHAGLPSSLALGAALEPILLGLVSYRPLATRRLSSSRAHGFGRYGRPEQVKFTVGRPGASRRVRNERELRGKLLKFEEALRGAWRARIDIMYSPPPDEAAEALARDPIDPVEATESAPYR